MRKFIKLKKYRASYKDYSSHKTFKLGAKILVPISFVSDEETPANCSSDSHWRSGS